jgi:hypothetical protein
VVVVVVVVVVVALDPAGIETHTSSWKISKKTNFHFPELITRTGFRQLGTYLGLVGTFFGGPLWNKHVFVWHGPLGLRRKSVNMGHVQEAWRWFQKGRAKLVHSSHSVGAPGRGSKRTRRVYQRRRKHLVNAKDIFMGKYREFVQDTCVVIAAVRDMHAWRRSLMSTMAMMMATMTGDSSGDDDNGVRD